MRTSFLQSIFSLIVYHKLNKVGIPKNGDTAIIGVVSINEYFHLFARADKFGELSKTLVILPSFVATSKYKGFGGEYLMC